MDNYQQITSTIILHSMEYTFNTNFLKDFFLTKLMTFITKIRVMIISN